MHGMVSSIVGSVFPPEMKPVMQAEGTTVLDPTGRRVVQPPSYRPQVVGEGGALVGRSGDELYKNPKTFPPAEETADIKQRAAHGAAVMQKLYDNSQAATMDRPRMEQLRDIAAKNPGGVTTWIRGFLADKGLNVAGKSDLDLWSAMINQAAPRTREAGSGVFTDKDFEAAVRGLPNTLKSKEGNLALADMALDWLDYRIERGTPAGKYLAGDYTRKQAFDEVGRVKIGRRGARQPRADDPLGLR